MRRRAVTLTIEPFFIKSQTTPNGGFAGARSLPENRLDFMIKTDKGPNGHSFRRTNLDRIETKNRELKELRQSLLELRERVRKAEATDGKRQSRRLEKKPPH
jgi:hypothetical protein